MAFTAERNLIAIFDNFEILPELLDVGLVTLHLGKFYLLPEGYLWLQLGRIQDFSRGGGRIRNISGPLLETLWGPGPGLP